MIVFNGLGAQTLCFIENVGGLAAQTLCFLQVLVGWQRKPYVFSRFLVDWPLTPYVVTTTRQACNIVPGPPRLTGDESQANGTQYDIQHLTE